MLTPVSSYIRHYHPVSDEQMTRISDAYFKFLQRLTSSGRSEQKVHRALVIEAKNLPFVLHWAIAHRPCSATLAAVASYGAARSPVRPEADVLEKALDSLDTLAHKEPYQGAVIQYNLGSIYQGMERYEEASDALRGAIKKLVKAPQGASAHKDSDNLLLKCYFLLGEVAEEFGNYQEALDAAKEGIEIAGRLGDQGSVAAGNFRLAAAYRRMKQHQDALSCGAAAVAIFEQLGGRQRDVAEALRAQALSYIDQKDWVLALAALNKSISIFEKLGQDKSILECLDAKDFIQTAQGDYPAVIATNERALEIGRRLEAPKRLVERLIKVHNCCMEAQRPSDSVEFITEALAIALSIPSPNLTAIATYMLAATHAYLGQVEAALEYGHLAVSGLLTMNDFESAGQACLILSVLHTGRKEYDEAERWAKEAVEISSRDPHLQERVPVMTAMLESIDRKRKEHAEGTSNITNLASIGETPQGLCPFD